MLNLILKIVGIVIILHCLLIILCLMVYNLGRVKDEIIQNLVQMEYIIGIVFNDPLFNHVHHTLLILNNQLLNNLVLVKL